MLRHWHGAADMSVVKKVDARRIEMKIPVTMFFLLLTVAAITLACGSSSHVLQTLSISPATADAQNFPGGLVQFTATGHYNSMPTEVEPLQASWGVCIITASSQQPSAEVTVNGNGLAQCVSGANGTFTVFAFSSTQGQGACPLWVTACGGGGCRVTGTAQLTCP